MGSHWPVFSRITTKSTILSLYGRIWVGENPYSRKFYVMYEIFIPQMFFAVDKKWEIVNFIAVLPYFYS